MESNESMQPTTSRPQTPAVEDPGGRAARSVANAFRDIRELVNGFAGVANADACVGPVQSADGHSVIPIASVSLQSGFGMGFGGGSGGKEGEQGEGSGGGGGGGGRANARPIAVIDVSSDGVRVQPILDLSNIILASLALIGLGMLTARGRGGGGLQKQLAGAMSRD